jgi:PKD domain
MSISKERMFVKTLFVVILLSLFISPAFLSAWEAPMAMAAKAGYKYYKPEVGFAPSGGIYMAYREKEPSGNSDIMVCYYDGKEMVYHNVSEGASFWSKFKAYESDIEVTADGKVHVVWIALNRNDTAVHHVRYRYLDGNTWSEIMTLGDVHVHSGDVVFDNRLGVDSIGNVHVVLQEEHSVVIRYFGKFGDTLTGMINVGNPGSRLKHPDIAVDDNYIHLIWMRKVGFPYVIMRQKIENRLGGTWGPIEQITFPVGEYASQKSRIDLDSQGFLHLAEFYKKGIIKKLKYFVEQGNGSWTPYVNLSDPNKLQLYHWAALEVRDNSIIGTMQLGSTSGGSGIYYRWKQNNVWSEYAKIPSTSGAVHQSTDLSADGLVAAVVYAKTSSSIMMTSSEPITATGTLEAEFSNPDPLFAGSDVTFDASNCANLNPDFNIVSYEWDFGDGTITTTSSPTIAHSFSSYNVDLQVTLKITAETGETGTFYKDIHVHALFSAIVTDVVSKSIRTLFYSRAANMVQWIPNPKNDENGYPAISKYEIWRALSTSVIANSDYVYVGEVASGTQEFLDYYGVQENSRYIYVIVSVDAEGHKSPYDNQ